MILADPTRIDEQLSAQPQASQDEFPLPPQAPPAQQTIVPGELGGGANPVGAAVDEGGELSRELSQPGSGHAIVSAFQAATDRQREVDNFSADTYTARRLYEPVMEAINAGRAPDDQLPNPYDVNLGGYDAAQGISRPLPNGAPRNADNIVPLVWARVAELKKNSPQLSANIPGSEAQLKEDVLAEQRTALGYADLTQQSQIGKLAGFAGSIYGSLSDPPNILASTLGAGPELSLLKTFLVDGSLNTALDAVGLPSRAARYRTLGQPLSGGDIATELAGDFLVGGGLPVGIKAGLHALLPEVRTAARVVEDEANRAAENPLANSDVGRDQMRQAALTAMTAIDDNRPDLLPDTTGQLERALDPSLDAARRRQGFTVESFDPNTVTTDAAAMQYKGGADEAGVTDRLQGVTQWDPAKAGLSLIWEKADGQLVIADGHQRLGLARRLAADGQNDVNLFGIRYREADGFTAQDMRVIAALKNIAEGTGTGLDAARLLRDAPEGIKELPPRSPLVRQARDLAGLSDTAFGMTLNGQASERDAAIVGRHVRDPELHAPILKFLSQDSPDTAEEAELFVRQALAAGANKHVQSDMFGDFIKADLIFPQRVKILKNALTALRKDKALFGTLTDRASAIEAAGNELNAQENASRRETAARAFATLKALAERKGRISDALQKAAEEAARTGDRRAATTEFVQNVRDAVASGELDRPGAGDAIGDVGPETESAPVSRPAPADQALDEKSLSLFGDPIEKPEAFHQQAKDLARELAPEQTVIPGAEPSAQQLAAARDGRIKADAPQADAGGLFAPKLEDTADMFAPADGAALVRGIAADKEMRAGRDAALNESGRVREALGELDNKMMDAGAPAIGGDAAANRARAAFANAHKGELSPMLFAKDGKATAEHFGQLYDAIRTAEADAAAQSKMIADHYTMLQKEFGDAADEVQAIRSLDQKATFPDPLGDGETTVREARRQMEREARAVEALRNCIKGEGP